MTKALKSKLNVLQRSLFITIQTEREYFPFERSCQTCPVLCLLSEAPWSFFGRKEHYWIEERKGDNSLAGNSLQKSVIKNILIKKVQGASQLETAASHELHGKDLYAEPSSGSSLEPSSVTPWSVSILLTVKLLYFVGQWQGATQTASVQLFREHKSKSVPMVSGNHLGFCSTGIGRDGAAYIRLHNGFEDT